MAMWKCGSSWRRGRRRRTGLGQSSETCSQREASLLETEASRLSRWFFLQLRGKPKLSAELSRTGFNEAQAVEEKVGVWEYADRLQRPEGQKEKQSVSLLLPHCLLTSVTSVKRQNHFVVAVTKLWNNFSRSIRSEKRVTIFKLLKTFRSLAFH